MTQATLIRPVQQADFGVWLPLFNGYHPFYGLVQAWGAGNWSKFQSRF